MNWNDTRFFLPRSEGVAVAEALMHMLRYAFMMHDTSFARDMHQWLVTIYPDKEEKLSLMLATRSSWDLTRGHQGTRRRGSR